MLAERRRPLQGGGLCRRLLAADLQILTATATYAAMLYTTRCFEPPRAAPLVFFRCARHLLAACKTLARPNQIVRRLLHLPLHSSHLDGCISGRLARRSLSFLPRLDSQKKLLSCLVCSLHWHRLACALPPLHSLRSAGSPTPSGATWGPFSPQQPTVSDTRAPVRLVNLTPSTRHAPVVAPARCSRSWARRWRACDRVPSRRPPTSRN